jgi:hypothetical protein
MLKSLQTLMDSRSVVSPPAAEVRQELQHSYFMHNKAECIDIAMTISCLAWLLQQGTLRSMQNTFWSRR